MKKFWGETINYLLIINTNNEEKKRRGQLLALFLLLIYVLAIILTVQNIVEFFVYRADKYRTYVVQDAVLFAILFSFWFLNRNGKIILTAYICFFFIIIIVPLLVVPVIPYSALFMLALPIAVSSFVIRPTSSLIFSTVSFVTYSITFIVFKPISEYQPFPPLILFTIAFVTWITASQLENALESSRESEKKFRNLFNNVPVGLYRITSDGKILEANPTLVKMFGYTDQTSLLKTNLNELYIDPEATTSWLGNLSQHTDANQGNKEVQLKRQDGTSFWALNSAQVIYDTDNAPLYFEGSMIDITKRKQTEKRISDQLARLAALRAIDAAITGGGGLQLILRTILDQVLARLKVDAVAILIFDPKTNSLKYNSGLGFRTIGIEKTDISLEQDSYSRRVFRGQKVIAIRDLVKEKDHFKRYDLIADEGFSCYYGIPLLAKNQVKGILEVFLREDKEHDWEWLDYLEMLAKQTAIAIDNTSLFRDLQKSNHELREAYETTIEGWSRALDLRDRETEGHTLRVTETTLHIARAMGFNEEELVNIRRGSLLHDIGKMGVPDHILLKPGKLSAEETKIIQQHPQFAYDLLSPIEYLQNALDIPYYHHEKWDGTGYPHGLMGEEIPLPARIFAVVDVYDAVTSDRPYRKAWSKKKAFVYIRELTGTHFDPLVVEMFFSVMKTDELIQH